MFNGSALEYAGNIKVCDSGKFIAPKLENCWNLDAAKKSRMVIPSLTSIIGSLMLRENSEAQLSTLETVKKDVQLHQGAKFRAPSLTTIGGNLVIAENSQIEAPGLKSIGGLKLGQGAKLESQSLDAVLGTISLEQNAQLLAPALISSGDVQLSENAIARVPSLQCIVGRLSISDHGYMEAMSLLRVREDVLVGPKARFVAPKAVEIGRPGYKQAFLDHSGQAWETKPEHSTIGRQEVDRGAESAKDKGKSLDQSKNRGIEM